jgi:hypothetical protein
VNRAPGRSQPRRRDAFARVLAPANDHSQADSLSERHDLCPRTALSGRAHAACNQGGSGGKKEQGISQHNTQHNTTRQANTKNFVCIASYNWELFLDLSFLTFEYF